MRPAAFAVLLAVTGVLLVLVACVLADGGQWDYALPIGASGAALYLWAWAVALEHGARP